MLSISDETNKSCCVSALECNMPKNRSDIVVPYDKNRVSVMFKSVDVSKHFFNLKVILAPLPHKEGATYINASFIEGYANFDCYIITQDPLENTIEDFWRMISEQSITTIIMMSEVCLIFLSYFLLTRQFTNKIFCNIFR